MVTYGQAITYGTRVSCSKCCCAAVANTVDELLAAGWFRRAGAWLCGTHKRKGDVDDGSVPFVSHPANTPR